MSPQLQPKMNQDLLDLFKDDDGSGDDVSTVKQGKPVGPSGASSPRLVVVDVVYDAFANSAKLVRAVDTLEEAFFTIELRGAWASTPAEVGHIFRVILTNSEGDFTQWRSKDWKESDVVVDDIQNFFIHHPDTLISGTSVAESFFCLRKAVINGRTPDMIDYSTTGGEAALFGSMIHELFQNVLIMDSNTRDYSTADELSQVGGVDEMAFYEAVEDVLFNHADDLYASKNHMAFSRKLLHKVVPQITDWYREFMGSGNYKKTEGVQISTGRAGARRVVVSKVHDIEELVWSPVLGLKGKIDASVFLRVDGLESGIAVLELKTGKPSGYSATSHNAQVALYNLLLSDRKDTTIRYGLLTYISYLKALETLRLEEFANPASQVEQEELSKQRHKRKKQNEEAKNKMVASTRGELIGLLMQRNSIAHHLRLEADVEELPPLLQGDSKKCASCFARKSCLVQHKLLQNGSAQSEDVTSGPGADLYRQTTGYLTSTHAEYYNFWRDTIADEEELSLQGTREIWTKPSVKREKRSKGIADLILVTKQEDGKQISPHALLSPAQRVEAKFAKRQQVSKSSLLELGFSKGDFVMISAEKRWDKQANTWEKMDGVVTWQSGLSTAIVESVSKEDIVVAVERSLTAWVLHQNLALHEVAWRIDSLEMVSSYKTAKQTLELMFCEEDKVARLRNLVVDGHPPVFTPELDDEGEAKLDNEALEGMRLNDEQMEAVRRSHLARDYLLILGMPGTGKSETLAAIVLTWARRGKSVLLCSHTNAAVDNMLERLLDNSFKDFVRVGRNHSVVSERILPYHVNTLYGAQGASRAEVDVSLDKTAVVATTCLGIHHAVVQRRDQFDVVVVDEASQVSQPVCLGPITLCRGPFVLVGDHYQLPPLQRAADGVGPRTTRRMHRVRGTVINLRVGGGATRTDEPMRAEESLFRRLCERHPDSIVVLKRQYRMAGDIARLCNALVYGGSLRSGSAAVSSRTLRCTNPLATEGPAAAGWKRAVANEHRAVVFVDVADGSRETEADTAAASVALLLARGLAARDVAVLSPFRAQVTAVRAALARQGGAAADAEVSTIDRYQGRDCAAVIVSFAAGRDGEGSRGAGGAGGQPLLREWRRVNVAVTRAKAKLVLIGGSQTMQQGGPFLRELVELVRRNGWLVRREPPGNNDAG